MYVDGVSVSRPLEGLPLTYTVEQAASGHDHYQQHCASCHGLKLDGSEAAPGLHGRGFSDHWRTRTLGDFVVTNQTMPVSDPGGLAENVYEALIAFVLSQNGLPEQRQATWTCLWRARVSKRLIKSGSEPPVCTILPRKSRRVRRREWLHHRGTPHSTNYSDLDQIDADNAAELEIAWRWKSDNFGPRAWAKLSGDSADG